MIRVPRGYLVQPIYGHNVSRFTKLLIGNVILSTDVSICGTVTRRRRVRVILLRMSQRQVSLSGPVPSIRVFNVIRRRRLQILTGPFGVGTDVSCFAASQRVFRHP